MAGKYAHMARIKATTSSNSKPNPKQLFIHELGCEGKNIIILQKKSRLGIYIHVRSRQICSFQTTVGQIRICEVCLSQVSHFEVDEAQVKFGKVS